MITKAKLPHELHLNLHVLQEGSVWKILLQKSIVVLIAERFYISVKYLKFLHRALEHPDLNNLLLLQL